MFWFVRISSDRTSKEQLVELLKIEKYILSKEYSKKSRLHYHIIAEFPTESPEELRATIYTQIADVAHHTSRGGKSIKGTQTLDIKPIGNTDEDFFKAACYTVKDKDYIFSGFSKEQIEEYVANSFQKEETPTQQIKNIIEAEKERSMLPHQSFDSHNVYTKILLVKSKFGLEVHKNKISALVLSAYIDRYPEYAKVIAKEEIKKLKLP